MGPARLTGLYLSRDGVRRGIPAEAPRTMRALGDSVTWHATPGAGQVVSAVKLQQRLTQHYGGDSAKAQALLRNLVTNAEPGVVFRRHGGTFVDAFDIAAGGRGAAVDGGAGAGNILTADAAHVPAAVTDLLGGVRRLSGAAIEVLKSHRNFAGAGGALALGALGADLFLRKGSSSRPLGAPDKTAGARLVPARDATLRQIASVARAQVTGLTDHGADGKLTATVAAYMGATRGIVPGPTRDWTTDFISWVTREAHVPVGVGGVGAIDASDLLDWAGDAKAIRPIADAQPGELLVTTDAATGKPDVGVITAVDGDNLHVVYGNRLITHSADGNDVGAVRTFILSRTSRAISGVIDPTVKAIATAAPMKPAPVPQQPPAGSTGSAPELTTASIARRGTAPPVASPDAPTRAQLDNYFNWAASQYAGSDAQAAELSTLMKNVATIETHFGINALNLWDSNAVGHTPSFGMFQFIKPTFDGFSDRARSENPGAWAKLGAAPWSDWRAQALTTSWALAQPPSDFSRANNGWPGQHGRYWSRWSSISNMVNGRGSVPQGDPRTSSFWSDSLNDPHEEASRNKPVSERTVWPRSWYASGTRLSDSQLADVVRTGTVYGIPQY